MSRTSSSSTSATRQLLRWPESPWLEGMPAGNRALHHPRCPQPLSRGTPQPIVCITAREIAHSTPVESALTSVSRSKSTNNHRQRPGWSRTSWPD